MMHIPYVYVVEPQTIFIPTLSWVVFAAGGCIVRVDDDVDIEQLAAVRADFALLDLDYTKRGVADGLALFRSFASGVKAIVLTDERDFARLAEYRESGAAAVLTKNLSVKELRNALRMLFDANFRLESVHGETEETNLLVDRDLAARRFGRRVAEA
jgi:DNA-binding NarL/FixJ family response regulator